MIVFFMLIHSSAVSNSNKMILKYAHSFLVSGSSYMNIFSMFDSNNLIQLFGLVLHLNCLNGSQHVILCEIEFNFLSIDSLSSIGLA